MDPASHPPPVAMNPHPAQSQAAHDPLSSSPYPAQGQSEVNNFHNILAVCLADAILPRPDLIFLLKAMNADGVEPHNKEHISVNGASFPAGGDPVSSLFCNMISNSPARFLLGPETASSWISEGSKHRRPLATQ